VTKLLEGEDGGKNLLKVFMGTGDGRGNVRNKVQGGPMGVG